jgi:hypothetical protein
MNRLKDYIRNTYEGRVEHFLTYADNYAIGYFKKQVNMTNIESLTLFNLY